MKRRTVSLLGGILAAAIAVAIPAGALGSASGASSHTVTLHEFHFHPGTLSIHRGDRVTWVWKDSGVEHNVTFHGFHSHTQENGTYTVRFTHAGTFSYHCTIHVSEGMKGKIVVH